MLALMTTKKIHQPPKPLRREQRPNNRRISNDRPSTSSQPRAQPQRRRSSAVHPPPPKKPRTETTEKAVEKPKTVKGEKKQLISKMGHKDLQRMISLAKVTVFCLRRKTFFLS